MGCAPSASLDVDTLPIKAQCRTAFSRCSTTDRTNSNGQGSEKQLGQQPDAEGHDVVLCYPLGGTIFGLELQARYEKLDTVSLWTLDHFLSVPGTPLTVTKSMSGGIRIGPSAEPGLEIKPAPEAAGAGTPNLVMSREVRMCRRGVVVLVTAGCTWDDGVLTCLRLASKFLRPLVMVHCVQSCPLPGLEEWPLDIRPVIAASGAPVKYLTQHSTEALRDVERRMLAAAAAAAPAPANTGGAAAAAAAPATNPPPPPQPPPPVAAAKGNCSCMEEPKQVAQPQPQAAQHQPPPQQQQQPQQAAATATAADAAGAGPGMSLAALQASDSSVCRRACQLLGPWTCGSARAGADGGSGWGAASRSDSPVTTTLVEALVSSQWTSYSAIPSPQSAAMAVAGAHAIASVSTGGGREQGGVRKSRERLAMHSQQQAQQQQRTTKQYAKTGGSGGSGDLGCGCVLRYRDPCWATPVAFVCAQLEGELGRNNVSVQVAASAMMKQSGSDSPGGAATASAAARLGLQSAESGFRSHNRRQQTSAAAVTAIAAAAAAAGVLQLSHPSSRSSSGSSGRCSTGEDSGGRQDALLSESTSRRTSGGAPTPPAARANVGASADELVAFAGPSADDCGASSLATSVTGARTAAGARRVSVLGGVLRPEPRSISWTEDADSQQAANPNVVCVYFMTPGLSAPHGCLSEVGAGLARGRRMLLVVDGECCQRLPDYAPLGVTPEAWKAMRRLWHDRLLYVPDYHTSFCALLKQGIIATAAQR